MFTTFLGLALIAGSAPSAPKLVPPLDRIASWVRATDRQRVEVWTDRQDDPFRRGDRARVYFKSEVDGYVAVLRVDTDGRVRVLFPREPWEDNFARGGSTFEVLDRNNEAFSVDDYPGVGYVFAVSSPDPFSFDEFVRGDHWDYRTIADGRVRGDPYVTLTDFASKVTGPGEYDYDIVPYYVEQHYDYPRFLCYDCHSYVSYSYWDPYQYYCNRFRIVIYDDYYYYPYRYYGGNVVIVRPYRPAPRYVFKDYDGRGDYVTRVRQRPSDGRVYERDRTSADVGGRGTIPAPIDTRRRTVDRDGSTGGTVRNRDAGQGGTSSSTRRRTDDGTSSSSGTSGSSDTRRREADSQDQARGIVPRDGDAGSGRTEPSRRRTDTDPGQSSSDRSGSSGSGADGSSDQRRVEPDRGSSSSNDGSSDRRGVEPDHGSGSASSGGSSRPSVEPRRQPSGGGTSRAEPRGSSRPQPSGQPQLRRRRPG